MSATEQDRERAAELLGVIFAEAYPREGLSSAGAADANADRIAQALADERERARAPFLALAEEWTETSARYARVAKNGDRSSDLIASLSADAAMRIRRAGEDSQ